MEAIDLSPASISRFIDHTLLRPDASREDVLKLCREASAFGFKSVCVNLSRLSMAVAALKGSRTVAIAVVGFPLGATSTSIKRAEAAEAIALGAAEIDMVMNIGMLKDKESSYVANDIREVVEECGKIPVKVIIEACLLDREEKICACRMAVDAGAAFVKTSTGFSSGGATVEDVRLMREAVGPDFGVKASGGIKTYEDAAGLIRAGASRLGTSASVAIAGGPGRSGDGY